MTEQFNRRGFIGLLTGIAAFFGFTNKAKAEEPINPLAQAYGNPEPVEEPIRTCSPRIIPNVSDKYKNGEWPLTLKNSSFLVCPQCGSDLHWARCECGFVWTNRVDEVAGGGERQYKVNEVEYPTAGIADSKTLVEPFRPPQGALDPQNYN